MSLTLRTGAVIAAWALLAPAVNAAEPAGGAAPGLGGPVVAGVCLLSREAVLANSKVGLAATARLQQLDKTADGGLAADRASIESEAKALESQKATLTAAQFDQRRRALAKRAQAFQAKTQATSRQIEATRLKVVGRISQEAQPVVAEVYQAHGCGLLVSRDAILGGNMANDLTPGVVQALDAKVSTIDFDLEPAPASAAPAR